MTNPEHIYAIDAYADGELDPIRAMEVEKLMTQRPELRQRYESVLNLRAALRGAAAQDRASDLLQPRIERAVQRTAPTVRRWAALAASFVLGLVLAGGLAWTLLVPREPALAEAIVSAHMRSLLAEQPIDVASSDRHTVKPWLARKVPQSPDVVDLAQQGFPLLGGRVDVIDGNPIATIVYGRAKHLVSLMTFAKPIKLPVESTVAGFHIRSWSQGDLTYVAVSDIPASELATFEDDMRRSGT
ncbi:MAG: anti-sigma factor [Methylobacteriaceae bacterium]|nr:anti-sigma factor [Methylobacteriaceae bacterium]